MGEPAVSPTYCPINGAYTFTYSVNDGTENSLECSGRSSEISDCPYGFGFNLKFRECSFGNMGKSLENQYWYGLQSNTYPATYEVVLLPLNRRNSR